MEHLEKEMNQMFKDLNDLEGMISKNWDLGSMETLMGTTKNIIKTHTSAFDGIKQSILLINKEAESAMDDLNFYD